VVLLDWIHKTFDSYFDAGIKGCFERLIIYMREAIGISKVKKENRGRRGRERKDVHETPYASMLEMIATFFHPKKWIR
jgi:hypothetical protein